MTTETRESELPPDSEVRGIERVKWTTIVFLTLLFAILVWILWVRLAPRPVPPETVATTHYFPLAGDGNLFTIATGATNAEIRSDGIDCERENDTSKQFVVGAGERFRCGMSLMKLYADVRSATLVLTGFDEITLPAIVGSGRRHKRPDGIPRYVFPGPGVGIDHLRMMRATECAAPVPADAIACIENGGATGSLLVFPNQEQPVSLGHGERMPVRTATTLFLGFVPMALTGTTSEPLRLEVTNGTLSEGWRRIGGNRLWMGLELPAWTLAQPRDAAAPRVVHRFLPEAEEFGPGNLSAVRIEPEQEEEIQLLIDHEVLCVGGVTRLRSNPVLTMRDPATPGCPDLDGNPRQVPPLTAEAAGAVRDAQRDPRIRDLLAAETRRLGSPTTRQDDRESILLFDHRRLLTVAPDQPQHVPVAVLGIRPRTTLYRVTPPLPAAPAPTIRFEPNTSSAVLETLESAGAMAVPPLLQLVRRNGPMHVCEGVVITGGDSQPRTRRGTLPLGAVSFNGADVSWAQALGTAAPASCVTLTRTRGVIEINAGALRSRSSVTDNRNRSARGDSR
ncbi:MAG TPA: hypothetical protein VF057_02585 [Thermoanaerobaculia bacterium]